jgi:hypothetical protein
MLTAHFGHAYLKITKPTETIREEMRASIGLSHSTKGEDLGVIGAASMYSMSKIMMFKRMALK